jgi:hypothetical protein
MDSTKSFIKVYNISSEISEDFEFDFDTAGIEQGSNDILTEMVPNVSVWDDVGWMEVEEYEYDPQAQMMHFTLETKWESPVSWLTEASKNVYFQNKLITMATIQKDETLVTGVAVMDGEVLQHKPVFEMDSAEVEKYYNDNEPDYELDDLDNQLWDSITKFVNVCEQFYLERDKENDNE